MIRSTIGVLLASIALSMAPAFAQTATEHESHHATPAAAPLSDGEVRKIDRSAGKITIKHGELRNLDMPAMTMVFRAKDPAMLDKLTEGDKIKFTAEKVEGVYTVTAVTVVRQP